MPDWTKSMQQTYEYYVVDPNTWEDSTRLDCVKTSTIARDSDTDTLGSATIDVTESIGECYIRIYLIAIQNGVTEKFPLGTFLVQSPSTSFNGKIHSYSLDAYTPLIELKENQPPIGYSFKKKDNIMDKAYDTVKNNLRAPVVEVESTKKLSNDFVANTDDNWLTFNRDLISNAEYEFDLDEMGRVLFSKVVELDSMQPVYTYSDDNSSILYPDITIDRDLYGIPNVVEVIYSDSTQVLEVSVTNSDKNSPTSTVNRGRKIVYRDTSPRVYGEVTKDILKEYATKLLTNLSTLECTVSYTHGYRPIRLGDCVRLNYEAAGITDVKARIISQTIKCIPGCPVTEKATFKTKLWG